jgi:uncharacterized protein (TIGR03437 family)
VTCYTVATMYSRICAGWVFATLLAIAQPTVGGVSNGASFQANISPGSVVSIFGSNLAPGTEQATTVPLPIVLSGTSVTIGGIPAPLYFVSDTQINAQIPFELQAPYGLGERMLVVTTQGGASSPFPLFVQPKAPAIFTQAGNGQGNPLLMDATFHLVDVPTPGQTLILYATGLGPTNPPVATGAGGNTQEPLSRLPYVPRVMMGERQAEVTFAGAAPGFVGVYQLNFVMPPEPLLSERLYIGVPGGGQQFSSTSNITTLVGAASMNVANVSASISGVYPSPTSLVTFSLALLVAKLNVKFDILAGAKPFSLLATADGLGSNEKLEIDFDPAAGTFVGTASTPTAAARAWDFSAVNTPVLDLQNGNPFAGNLIPISRVDPRAIVALGALPFPTMFSTGSATGQFGLMGMAPAGSTFALNNSDNSAPAEFAGYLDISGSRLAMLRSTTLRLYVDGILVSTWAVPFQTP